MTFFGPSFRQTTVSRGLRITGVKSVKAQLEHISYVVLASKAGGKDGKYPITQTQYLRIKYSFFNKKISFKMYIATKRGQNDYHDNPAKLKLHFE